MHTVLRWAATCGVALAVNLAALAGASALTLPKPPLKADAAPQAIEVRKGGGVSGGPIIRRMGGGRHGISPGGRTQRFHAGNRGSYRAMQYGGRGSYRAGNRGEFRAIRSGGSARYRNVNRGRDYAIRSGNVRRNAYYNQRQWDARRAQRVRNADGRYYGGGKRYHRYDKRHHGDRYKHKHGKYKHYHDGWWYAWPWWSVGIGIGIGSYWGDYWDTPVYAGYDAHVAWCLRRYRSYDPASDTYLGYDGRYHRCISPYMY